jgi:hypothetical protein
MLLYCDLRQRVQILTAFCAPPTLIVALCTLTCQRVLVRRFEWLTLLPDCPDLRHISHLAMVRFDCDKRFE